MIANPELSQPQSADRAAAAVICPNCGEQGMRSFYEVRNIPVHSVLLMQSREEALRYPRRDLRLGFCGSCGFICNMLFDPTVHEYSTSYEEPQTFSPTFNSFARNLAQRWVEQYRMRGKTVLEIGCGKGEFLLLLAELGVGKGIGVDPAFVPNRLKVPDGARLEFVQDFYGEKYSHLKADAICCRHTLEHIAPTGDFMRTLRRTIGSRTDTLLLFEIPDMWRVLKETAFWDIYYEHCSYFTAGSIAQLFNRTGFEVLELQTEYDDQYLIVTGKPHRNGEASNQASDPNSVAAAVATFAARVEQARKHWLGLLSDLQAQHKRVVVWGGGSKAVSFITTIGLTDQIDFIVDVNPYKHGKFLPGSGHAVKDPRILKHEQPDVVILMNRVYVDEVGAMLNDMGVQADILAPDDGTEVRPQNNGSGVDQTSRISAEIPSSRS